MTQSQYSSFMISPGGAFKGRLRVPGDKSISHRALMLGALASGDTSIEGFLEGEDTRATMRAFQSMGVNINRSDTGTIEIEGVGLDGLVRPQQALDLGNSGTSVRLLAGLMCGQAFSSTLVGDESLMSRPMRRIVEPLRQMGADIQCSNEGTLPLAVNGGQFLKGIDYEMPVASAQLKSAILLAGLYAEGESAVREPAITRDHTERMLQYFGCSLSRRKSRVCLDSVKLEGRHISVPADISSAAFFMVAASICEGSDLVLEAVGVNPTRHAIIEIMQMMGANIELQNPREVSGEPIADIRIQSAPLKGIEIPSHLVPIAIDEVPVLMIAAACAGGETVIRDATELRVKESDRIHAMCDGLRKVGVEVEEYEDGMMVRGGEINGSEVESYGDHRIAMSFAVAGLVSSETMQVKNVANVNTSFPGFSDCFTKFGMQIETRN